MKQKIKELRIQIDGLAQLVKGLKPLMADRDIPCHSYETREAYDKLILAKAWLGKCLQALDVPTPYKNDGNRHSKSDIEPTADTNPLNLNNLEFSMKNTNWAIMNHIEKVDWLRQEIQKDILQVLTEYNIRMLPINSLDDMYLWRVEQYLSEARFWLGFELQRIKETK